MKKLLKISGYTLLVLLIALNLFIVVTGKYYLYKTLAYNFVDIDDLDLFEHRTVVAGNGVEWPLHKNYNKVKMPDYLLQELVTYKSVAFAIIKNDSLFYDQYWEGYNNASLSNSFSMAKSIVSVLVGIAIDEGKIKSIDEPVASYIPEFKQGELSKITIRHLLSMSSGLDWDEAYANPLSATSEAYYGTDLYKLVTSQKAIAEPGKKFLYQSGNSELLALIVAKATGNTLSDYASEKLWKPLEAMHDAEWSLDKKNGNEKAYCCFYSDARDFARIGSLYLHHGNWKGTQIVPEKYVDECVACVPLLDNDKPNKTYGLHWWISEFNGEKIFYMRGILGQYVVVLPKENIVFVRLGHKRAEKNNDGELTDLPVYIKGVLEMTQNN